MDNIVSRDPTAMKEFSAKLSEFSDFIAKQSAALVQLCGKAEHAMQDHNGEILIQRLTDMAEDLQARVAYARALADRISRSADILEETEKEA